MTLRCSTESLSTNGQQRVLIRYNCSIGNPFSGPGSVNLRLNLKPRNDITGSEDDISIDFMVTSINPEDDATISDNSNFASVQLQFEAKANISIDNG